MVETALGVVLLVAATLVIGGLGRLARTDPGFDVAHVTSLRVNLPDSRYPYLEQVAFYDRLLPELARLPGVTGAGLVGPLPLSGSRYGISFELSGDVAGRRGPASQRRLRVRESRLLPRRCGSPSCRAASSRPPTPTRRRASSS